MMKISVLVLSLLLSLFVFSEDIDFYEENVFYLPALEEIKSAFPGDIIFKQTKGYKSECWVINKIGDNRFCTINKGTYCKVKVDTGEPPLQIFKTNEFNNIATSKAIAQKNLNGTVGVWKQSVIVKGKENKLKFACHNNTSFKQSDLGSVKSVETLGEIEKLEFLGKSGDYLKFLYLTEKKPSSDEILRTVMTERELEIRYTTDKILFYKGLVLEVISYESGMIEYKVLRPFKN